MVTDHLIPTTDICVNHHIEYSFISSLSDAGLIEISVVGSDNFIPEDELQKLERMINLHNELEINVPGIEAISHMLDRMEQMREEMRQLRNRLRFYED